MHACIHTSCMQAHTHTYIHTYAQNIVNESFRVMEIFSVSKKPSVHRELDPQDKDRKTGKVY